MLRHTAQKTEVKVAFPSFLNEAQGTQRADDAGTDAGNSLSGGRRRLEIRMSCRKKKFSPFPTISRYVDAPQTAHSSQEEGSPEGILSVFMACPMFVPNAVPNRRKAVHR